jgi:hypothetical protein
MTPCFLDELCWCGVDDEVNDDDVNDVNSRWPLVDANQIAPWMKIRKYYCHMHQTQWWWCEVFLMIAMKICDNNRLPWCDDGGFEGFHPWITFVKDDSRTPLKGEWPTKLFKLKMRSCSYMHWKFPYENCKNFKNDNSWNVNGDHVCIFFRWNL